MTAAAVVGAALIMRLSESWPAVAGFAVAIAVLALLSGGIVVNGRTHGTRWRIAWSLIGLGLVLCTANTMWGALGGLGVDVALGREAIDLAAAGLAGGGVALLLSGRLGARAVDVVFEGAIIAASCSYVAWAWAGARGMDHVATAVAILPIFAWVLVVWTMGRLLFLTTEQLVAYRILAAALVTWLLLDAVLVGVKLGGASVAHGEVVGLGLCACALWALAACHPSLRRSFAPVEVAPQQFGWVKLSAHLLVAIVAPVSLLLLPSTRESPAMTALVLGSAGLPVMLVGYLVRQIRGRARAEYRAQHDELTGLPNRQLFEDRAAAAFRLADRDGSRVAVLFLDLDRFKAINDSLGHATGNQLLQATATRLNAIVPEIDTVARFGGDEFTVLVSDLTTNDEVAELARSILNAFARPFRVGGRELHTSASIGVALYPDDGNDAETLLKNADIAMYRAKARGRDAFEFYTPWLALRAQTKLAVESGLRRALDNGNLELHYQPQIDAKTGHVFGLEALARWPHPKIGMIPPNVFVPVAEESNLVVTLGEWAMDTACAQLRSWLDDGIALRSIAVNVSARHFASDGFVDAVRDVLARHSIPGGALEIEITESIFLRDLERARASLDQLRELGVRCAIDDFGTGFSGLRYLADMSIDSLKIDQSFVSCLTERENAPIVDAIIALGQRLDLDIVAEGVETEDQLAFLQAQGCTRMQGYFFGRPCRPEAVEVLLRRDDEGAYNWREGGADVVDLTDRGYTGRQRTAASALLSAICDSTDDLVDVDTSGLPGLLAALSMNDDDRPATFARVTRRVAAGTCVGLVPLVAGLAAADALPNSVQNVVSATAQTVGLEIPHAQPPAVQIQRAVMAPSAQSEPQPNASALAPAHAASPSPSPSSTHAIPVVRPSTSAPPPGGVHAASRHRSGEPKSERSDRTHEFADPPRDRRNGIASRQWIHEFGGTPPGHSTSRKKWPPGQAKKNRYRF